jgi:subtilisin family serine protease
MGENNILAAFIDQAGSWLDAPGVKHDADAEVKLREPHFSTEHIIVKYRSPVTATSEHRRVFPGEGKQLKHDPRTPQGRLPDLTNIYAVKIKPGQQIGEAINEYLRDPNVEYAEPDYLRYPAATTPNDPYFSTQWALGSINAPRAWDSQKGDADIIVAVVDTGIDCNHPDLAGRCTPGWNFVDNNDNTMDQYGHGTHIAGIIGANSNNGVGIAGINWQSKLMALKVSKDDWGFYDSNTSAAIRYAADNGARVINMSFGGYSYSQALADAVFYAYNKGVILVGGAGNNGTREPFYPATLPGVIAVGATTQTDRMYNLGTWLDVSAPGDMILSLRANNATMCSAYNGDANYCLASGTSMATPHVVGAISLLLSKNSALTFAQVRNIFWTSADDLGPTGFDPYYGHGRIDLYNMLNQVSTADPTVQAFITSPTPYQHFGPGQLIDIGGYASGSTFSSYSLSIAAGENVTGTTSFSTTGFTLVGGGASPVIGGKLASFDPSTLTNAGIYTVKLSVTGSQGTNEFYFSLVFDPDLASGWPKIVGNQQSGGAGIPFVSERSVPTFADLKGDGYDKLYLGSLDCAFYGWDLNGATLPNWPKGSNCSDAAPAIGDLDLDGHKEIVQVSAGTVNAWRYDGSNLNGFPVYIPQASGAPSLGDINGDGKLEIIFGTSPDSSHISRLYALNNDGTILPGFPIALDATAQVVSPVSLCDLNGDQKPEIVFGTQTISKVYAFNSAGSAVSGWPVNISWGVAGPISCADLNQDGYPEIIVTTGDENSYIFDHNGNTLPGWPKALNNVSPAGLPLDINGDGNPEIIMTDNNLNVFDRFGANVAPYPIVDAVHQSFRWGAIGGNLSNSGSPEFLVPSYMDEGGYAIEEAVTLRLYNKNGEITNARFPKTTLGGPGLSSSLGSPAGPGSSYLATTANFYIGTKVFVDNNHITYSPQANPWPQFQHDLARTGNYNTDVIPPQVSCTPIGQAPVNSPINVSCAITDNAGVQDAQIYYKAASSSGYQSVPMSNAGGNSYQGTIPSTVTNVVGTNLQWYAVAHDRAINPTIYPAGAPDTVNTISIVDNQPPIINTTPVTGATANQPITIAAAITDNSNLPPNATLYYQSNGSGWTPVAMRSDGNGNYTAVIPGGNVVAATGVDYYLQATDGSNNTTTTATFHITVSADPDTTPPAISSTPVTTAYLAQPLVINNVVVTDNVGLQAVYLHYRIVGGGWQSRLMNINAISGKYEATIPSTDLNLAGLEYYIEAVDTSGNSATAPANAPVSLYPVTVIDNLPPSAPANLSAAVSGSGQVTLFWLPPATNADGSPLTDLAGYNITYRDATANGAWQTINVGNVTTKIMAGLIGGETYEFKVQAFDNKNPANMSAWTPTASATLAGTPQSDAGAPDTSPIIPVPDASPVPVDAGPETQPITFPDAGTDLPPVIVPDAGPETPPIKVPDAGRTDLPPVIVPDAGPETPIKVNPDAGTDLPPIIIADAGPEAPVINPDALVDLSPVVTADAAPEAPIVNTDAGTDLPPVIKPDANPEAPVTIYTDASTEAGQPALKDAGAPEVKPADAQTSPPPKPASGGCGCSLGGVY